MYLIQVKNQAGRWHDFKRSDSEEEATAIKTRLEGEGIEARINIDYVFLTA